MHAVGCQTWITLACLAVMSHWCKHSFCESVDHKTGYGLEQTLAENKISYGRHGLERNSFHLALNIPSHRDISKDKHTMRSVNHDASSFGWEAHLLPNVNTISNQWCQEDIRFDINIMGMKAIIKAFSLEQLSSKQTSTMSTPVVMLAIVEDVKKDDIVVRIGDYNNEVHDDYEREFKIDVLITHEGYDDTTYDNDIALIKIRPQDWRGIVFNDYVQPASLPKNNTEYEAGIKCHISGWGTTYKSWSPNILQAAVVPIISDSDCTRVYDGQITPRMFCAGYLSGGVDSCVGDSGGPFVCDIQGKYTVMGAISWGDGCAERNKPGVYAKVKEFLPWIKHKIVQETSCLRQFTISCGLFDFPSTLLLLQNL